MIHSQTCVQQRIVEGGKWYSLQVVFSEKWFADLFVLSMCMFSAAWFVSGPHSSSSVWFYLPNVSRTPPWSCRNTWYVLRLYTQSNWLVSVKMPSVSDILDISTKPSLLWYIQYIPVLWNQGSTWKWKIPTPGHSGGQKNLLCMGHWLEISTLILLTMLGSI